LAKEAKDLVSAEKVALEGRTRRSLSWHGINEEGLVPEALKGYLVDRIAYARARWVPKWRRSGPPIHQPSIDV
jgi:hypothetical protein